MRWLIYDEAHRSPYGLESYVQNTWRFGLDRVLAGVAMSDSDAERWIGTTGLPLDDVGSTSIELAGRLAELVEPAAARHRPAHRQPSGRPLAGDPARGDRVTHGHRPRRRVADRSSAARAGGLSDDAARQGAELELRLPDVRALMSERLAGQPTRANFRTGTLTVCTMRADAVACHTAGLPARAR